jgi:hypothetical protein
MVYVQLNKLDVLTFEGELYQLLVAETTWIIENYQRGFKPFCFGTIPKNHLALAITFLHPEVYSIGGRVEPVIHEAIHADL